MVDFNKHIRPEIAALIKRGHITIEEMHELRVNGHEWKAMVPALSIEALIAATEHACKNCKRAQSPVVTYDEAIHAVFAPELLKRLREYAEHVPVLLESNKNSRPHSVVFLKLWTTMKPKMLLTRLIE